MSLPSGLAVYRFVLSHASLVPSGDQRGCRPEEAIFFAPPPSMSAV
jgi:hypothetical protein